MAKRNYKPEEIVSKLRQADVLIAQGAKISTILDDFSRYIIAWKLCTTMNAEDVTDKLRLALTASGCDQARVVHKPRFLSDNGSS